MEPTLAGYACGHEASSVGARRPGRGSRTGRIRVRGDAASRRGDLEVARLRRASSGLLHIVEGKFDTVMGRDVLVTTGPTASGPMTSGMRRDRGCSTASSLREILGENGYWQDEDMEIDRRRKLIIGALDPRHDDVDQASCPGIGQLSAKNRNPNAARASTSSPTPTRATSSRSAISSSCRPATRRAASTTATTSGRAARRAATTSPTSARSRRASAGTDARSGSRTSATRPTPSRSPSRSTSGATTARPTTRTTSTSTPRLRVGQRPRRAARLRHPRRAGATRARTGSAGPGRGTRCWSPAAACPAATTASPSRRPTSSTTRAGPPTAACGRGACARAMSP